MTNRQRTSISEFSPIQQFGIYAFLVLVAMVFLGFPYALLKVLLKDATGVVILLVLLAIMFGPILVAYPFVLISGYRTKRRLQPPQTIIAEYTPPAGFTPAELGMLYDARMGMREVYATLLFLEQKNVVRFVDQGGTVVVQRTGLHQDGDYGLVAAAAIKATADRPLLALRGGEVVRPVKAATRASLSQKGYVYSGLVPAILARSGRTLIQIVVPGTVLIVIISILGGGIELAIGIAAVVTLAFAPLYVFMAVILSAFYAFMLGSAWTGTKKLRDIWPEIAGYREYIKMAELNHLQFESTDLMQREQSTILPYAVALGLNTKWQERFRSGQ